jgi:hypothetical protein
LAGEIWLVEAIVLIAVFSASLKKAATRFREKVFPFVSTGSITGRYDEEIVNGLPRQGCGASPHRLGPTGQMSRQRKRAKKKTR